MARKSRARLRELLARIRAVLRRAEGGQRRARRKQQRARYRFAGWELDLRTRRLTAPNGEVPTLTAGEFNLLTAFLRSPQQVLSREQLLVASRVHDEEVFDRSIDIQILRLRRKLETDPSEPRLIRTERGSGYVLSVPVEMACLAGASVLSARRPARSSPCARRARLPPPWSAPSPGSRLPRLPP
jgi:two-component system, OmpR family, response regulator